MPMNKRCILAALPSAPLSPARRKTSSITRYWARPSLTRRVKSRKSSRGSALLTPKAKLLMILEDKSSWNREAAARGLALIGDPDVSRALFDRMLTDHMIDSAIRDAFVRNIGSHYPFLTDTYARNPDRKSRESIIGIIGSSKDPARRGVFKKHHRGPEFR